MKVTNATRNYINNRVNEKLNPLLTERERLDDDRFYKLRSEMDKIRHDPTIKAAIAAAYEKFAESNDWAKPYIERVKTEAFVEEIHPFTYGTNPFNHTSSNRHRLPAEIKDAIEMDAALDTIVTVADLDVLIEKIYNERVKKCFPDIK